MEFKEIVVTLETLSVFIDELLKIVPSSCFIGLKGEMGSGKTTFTRYFINSLYPEYKEPVTSPTFTITNEYDTEPPIIHIDLFRLKTYDDLVFSGVEEFFFDRDGIVIVEWYDHIDYPIPNPFLLIHFEIIDENKRLLKYKFEF